MFILTISSLTASNLPWFMDLTFRFLCNTVLCSIGFYFHHQTHPKPCIISPLVQLLHSFWAILQFSVSSSVAYWTPSNLGNSPSGVISFCLSILSTWFSRQEYWSGLLLLPPVDHVLSELFTVSHQSLVALHGMLIASLSYATPFAMTRSWSVAFIWFYLDWYFF